MDMTPNAPIEPLDATEAALFAIIRAYTALHGYGPTEEECLDIFEVIAEKQQANPPAKK